MRKAGALLLLLMMSLSLLAAQEDGDPAVEPDWEDDYYKDDLYGFGDQTFGMSLGVVFPTLLINNGRSINPNFSPPVGGTGSLAYNYYLNAHFFVGAELAGMFISTLRGNTLFLIPLGIRAGYQFNIWRLEFPISAAIGMAWHRYLSMGYYGMYLRGGFSAFFRVTNQWSFGLSSNWFWFPEWTDDRSKNAYGNFVDLTLSARYHF
jgi:hypothetical protein